MRASTTKPGYYGLLTSATNPHGIDFSGKVEVPQGFPQGEWCWAQVVTVNDTRVTAVGGQEKFSLNGKTCLDDTFPYVAVYATGAAEQKVDDSPMDPLPPLQNYTANKNFTMFVMFKPDGTDSRWVSLKSIEWGFSYSASLLAGTTNYRLLPQQADPIKLPSAPKSSVTQPEWQSIIQTGTWGP